MNTIEENFKRDLQKYYKNEKAAKSIIALMRYANREDCKNDWITLDVIMEDVITSLADPEVKIDYSGKTTHVDNQLIDLMDKLYDKYYNKVDKNMFPRNRYRMYQTQNEYNVADMLNEIIKKGYPADKMLEWINEILSSKMSLEERAYFCLDVLKGDYFSFRRILKNYDNSNLLLNDSYKKQKKANLIKYMCEMPWIREKLVEIEGAVELVYCNERYNIDLSSPDVIKRAIEIYEEERCNSESILELMKSPRYQKEATLEEKNDDILNMLSNIDIRYIDHYVRFLDLEFDPEVLLIIAGLIRDNWNSIENPEAKCDFVYTYFLNKQVKDKKEYRKRLVYAKKFLEIVNDEETRQIKEAQERTKAQDNLIRVLSKTLTKSQNKTIGEIIKK